MLMKNLFFDKEFYVFLKIQFNKMEFKKLCYIDKSKKLVPFVPEMETKLVKIDKWYKQKIFPYKENLNYDNLLMTNIGVYSRTSLFVALNQLKIIKKLFDKPENLVITEANGGVGGLSIYLVQNFKFIKIVEVNEMHKKVIENNLGEYGFSNFKVYNNDYLDIMMKLKQDVIIFDPPWGGKKYEEVKKLPLELDNVDIACIIRKLYDAKKFKLVIFLIPYNFDLARFKKVSGLKYKKYDLGKQNLLTILGK